MGGEEVEDFVNCVIVAREIDVGIEAAFVSGVGLIYTGDVVVFNEDRAVRRGGGLEGTWNLEILSGIWVVKVYGVGGYVGTIVWRRGGCVIDAAGAVWGRVVFADSKRYRICCGGMVGAALPCEVMGEGQTGACIKCDVIGASAVALVGLSAPRDRSGWVLIVGYFVVVCVSIIKNVYFRGMRVCQV